MIVAVADPSDWYAASLFFDRVWCPKRFPGKKNFSKDVKWEYTELPNIVPDEFALRDEARDAIALNPLRSEISRVVDYEYRSCDYCSDGVVWSELVPCVVPFLQRAYAGTGIQFVEFHLGEDRFDPEFIKFFNDAFKERRIRVKNKGSSSLYKNNKAVSAVLDQGFVVSEESIEAGGWDLIRQVREDASAIHALRELRLWVNDLSLIQDESLLSDMVHSKMEAYRDSCRKHGVSTVLGAVKSVLSWEALSSISAGSAFAAICGGSVGLTGAAVALGKFSIKLAEIQHEAELRKKEQGLHLAYIQKGYELYGSGAGLSQTTESNTGENDDGGNLTIYFELNGPKR